MDSTPTFANPPIVELVLGAQFSPLSKLTSSHFGLFWKLLGNEWIPSDGQRIDDQFETFESSRRAEWPPTHFRLEPDASLGRVIFRHRNGDRLIQLQSTRFHLNWRKRKGFYPSYKNLIAEFEDAFRKFAEFTEMNGLGRILLNQWELTYIDSFDKGECWQSPADWSNILPGLFGELFPTDGLNLELDHRAAEWSFELLPRRGRLRIAAHAGRWGEEKAENLLLHMTARGPVSGSEVSALRAGLDIGHKAAVETFLRIVSNRERDRWGTDL